MTWVKLDDTMPDNPKVAMLSLPSRWAYISSICFAARNKTDGFIPATSLGAVYATAKYAAELEAGGLWEPCKGGWVIHDFLKHNRSREQMAAVSEIRSKVGSKGGANRWQIATASDKQIASSLLLSGSGSSSDPDHPSKNGVTPETEEKQTPSNLPRDRMLALEARLPGKYHGDPEIRDSFMLIVEDYTDAQILAGIQKHKRNGGGPPWPDQLRRVLLDLYPPVEDAHSKRVAEFKRGLERVEAAKARLNRDS